MLLLHSEEMKGEELIKNCMTTDRAYLTNYKNNRRLINRSEKWYQNTCYKPLPASCQLFNGVHIPAGKSQEKFK